MGNSSLQKPLSSHAIPTLFGNHCHSQLKQASHTYSKLKSHLEAKASRWPRSAH